jgi:hypothetical protein
MRAVLGKQLRLALFALLLKRPEVITASIFS